jgi:hypothetical protein
MAFGFVFLMMAYVLNHNERFIFDSQHPAWNHYQVFKWWAVAPRTGSSKRALAWANAVLRPASPPL